MKLEQKRNFEALLGDTFGFVGETARHFFPTMLHVNFLYLLVVAVMAYVAFSSGYADVDFLYKMHGTIGWWDWDELSMGMNWHPGLAWWEMALMVLCGLLLLVGGAIFAAYTPVYMILYRDEGRVPAFSRIVAFLCSRAGRLVIYFLAMLLLMILVAVVCIPVMILLVLSVVGIAAIPFILLAILMLSMLVLYAYLDQERPDFFGAIDLAWKAFRQSFWQNILSNGLMYLVTAILGVLPGMFTSLVGDDTFSAGGVYLGMVAVLAALVLHFAISALYSVNVGMIYFSSRVKNEENFYSM